MGSGPSAWFLMPLQGAVRTPQGEKQLINSCALDEQLWAGSGPHFSLVNGLLEVSLCFPVLMGEHVYGMSNSASPSCCPGCVGGVHHLALHSSDVPCLPHDVVLTHRKDVGEAQTAGLGQTDPYGAGDHGSTPGLCLSCQEQSHSSAWG